MESILVKIFATGLALSQVTTTPDAIKTEFDKDRDQPVVAELLHQGCNQMLKVFDLESINFDELLAMALDDPQAIGENKAFRGINFADLQIAYRQFCKKQPVERPAVDLARRDCRLQQGRLRPAGPHQAQGPEAARRERGARSQGQSLRGGIRGKPAARLGGSRRHSASTCRTRSWRPRTSGSIQHKGIDEHGLIRAFIGNLAQSGRPQGGSTITQQVVKNLLVGDDLTYERKIREMIVAARVETALTKGEILELYLNSVYLGRSAWGIELAAQSYFGKPASELTIEEGAFLAGLTKGPNFYSPDRHPIRARERLAYVLSRMREDGTAPGIPDAGRNLPQLPAMVAYERPRRDIGFHFVDQVAREAKALAGLSTITADSYTVRSTASAATAAGRGGDAAGRRCGATNATPAGCSSAAPRPTWARPSSGSRPSRPGPTSGHPGSRRSRMRGCRSTTCIGRPPWWSRSPSGKKNETWRVGLDRWPDVAARRRQCASRPASSR